MHEIISTLKRGINRSPPLDKALKSRLPLKKRLPRRVYSLDTETIDLLEEHQQARQKAESLQKQQERPVSRACTNVGSLAAPVGQWPGKAPKSGRKALYWGPKLGYHVHSGRGGFLLGLEPFRGGTTGNGNRVTKNLEVEARQRKLGIGKKMRSWVQILTTPTADTPGTTVLLHFDKNRYLFGNVSEGTQRACAQSRIGLSKVNNVFLTGAVNWHTTGGIIGMILTLADIVIAQNAERDVKPKREKGSHGDQPRLSLHGGKNLTHLLATTRRFVFRKGLPMEVEEVKGDQEHDEAEPRDFKPTYIDENVKVWAMAVKADKSSGAARKRSHDEMSEESRVQSNPPTSGDGVSKEELEHLDDQIRRGVVSHMFDSDWRLDALKTMKLSEVRMPSEIFIKSSDGKIKKYDGILPGGDDTVPDIDVLVRTPWPGASIVSLPSTTPSTESISYIVKNHQQRGKFDPLKAKDLGVTRGPNYRKLAEGQTVITNDGRTVTPQMVLGPGKNGGGFAIVELPDQSYIENLINREEWSSREVMGGVGAIIWILGEGVLGDARLLKFRETHSLLSHIISSPDISPNRIALESAATAAIRLNLLDPDRFPVPVHDNVVLSEEPGQKAYREAVPGLVIQLEPRMHVQDDNLVPLLDTDEVVKNASVEVQALAEIARTTIKDPVYQARLEDVQKDIPSKDAEVIILGSGSALPSKYRNVSATLVRVPGYGNYLFDCGENTLGQMKRVFGAELPQVLRDLKLIWISHLHADHHLGTASVIKEWFEETGKSQATMSNRLIVASDEGMLHWLEEYSEVEDYGYSRLRLLAMGSSGSYQKRFDQSDIETYGLSSITACHVNHCKGALAVVVEFPNTFKVAYSGDCLPSNEFARIGKGATLLIHEATFDDELAGDALAKKHSTTSDALRIGKIMGARRIMLTHFSQRYQKIPVMENKGGEDQVAIVAFDYMRVKVGDFAKFEHFKPALLELYKEKEE